MKTFENDGNKISENIAKLKLEQKTSAVISFELHMSRGNRFREIYDKPAK